MDPVLLYRHNDQIFTKAAYFGAFGQMVFWINLAHFNWTDLRAKDGGLASTYDRLKAVAGCGICGLAITAMLNFYVAKRVVSIVLQPGGQKIQLQTANLLGKRTHLYRTRICSTFEQLPLLDAPSSKPLTLKVEGVHTRYLLDRYAEIPNIEMFNRLFYK